MNLDTITIKGLRTHETRKGVAWSATVYVDGRRKYRVANDGNGGCCTFTPVDSNYSAMRVWLATANQAAAEALGRSSAFGALECLLCCMNTTGSTAMDAVPMWKAAVAAY